MLAENLQDCFCCARGRDSHVLARAGQAPGADGYFPFAQRTGETPREYRFVAFLSTTDRNEVGTLTRDYNAPDAGQLQQHYEGLPDRLQSERIDPHVPWLYGFKLDFR